MRLPNPTEPAAETDTEGSGESEWLEVGRVAPSDEIDVMDENAECAKCMTCCDAIPNAKSDDVPISGPIFMPRAFKFIPKPLAPIPKPRKLKNILSCRPPVLACDCKRDDSCPRNMC